MAILQKEILTIIKNVVTQLLDTKIVKLLQEKIVKLMQETIVELKALYLNSLLEKFVMFTMVQVEVLIAAIPKDIIWSLLEDFYTNVILPTSTEVLAIVNNIWAIPVLGMYICLLVPAVPIYL